MDKNTQHEVTPTPVQLAAAPATKPTPKRDRKPAAKKPEINYKALCDTLEKQVQELIDKLELQEEKNSILFKREKESRAKAEELEQKTGIAVQALLQKFQMLGNDTIQLLK